MNVTAEGIVLVDPSSSPSWPLLYANSPFREAARLPGEPAAGGSEQFWSLFEPLPSRPGAREVRVAAKERVLQPCIMRIPALGVTARGHNIDIMGLLLPWFGLLQAAHLMFGTARAAAHSCSNCLASWRSTHSISHPAGLPPAALTTAGGARGHVSQPRVSGSSAPHAERLAHWRHAHPHSPVPAS